MNLTNRVQVHQNNLSKNEKRILSEMNEKEVLSDNIKGFSESFGASPSSISKLSKKLGYKNFQDFILSVDAERSTVKHRSSSSKAIHEYYNRLIDNTNEMIHEEMIHSLISKIMNSGLVVIIGIGNSGFSAIEFASRLERMGIKVKAMTDPHQMKMQSGILNHEDLIIGISNSGETKEIVDSITLAKKNNVSNFVFTHHNESSLSDTADNVIIVSSNTQVNDEKFINSQISNLYLIDVISYELLEHDELLEYREKTLDVLKKF